MNVKYSAIEFFCKVTRECRIVIEALQQDTNISVILECILRQLRKKRIVVEVIISPLV